MSAAHLYLVAYDIASPRRWRRVYKTMCRSGERRQFSVFLCRLNEARMARLKAKLGGLVDAEEDRLMVVDLGPSASAEARLQGSGPEAGEALAWPLVI